MNATACHLLLAAMLAVTDKPAESDDQAPRVHQLRVRASPAARAVVLDWSGRIEPDVETVSVYRSAGRDGAFRRVGFQPVGEGTRWIDLDVEPGRSYRYYLKLRDRGGNLSEPTEWIPATTARYLRRINCGGPRVAAVDETDWEADTQSQSATTAFRFDGKVRGAGDDLLPVYQSGRRGDREIRYSFDVKPGRYRVVLYLAETDASFQARRRRRFDVLIAGCKRHAAVDVFAQAGGYTAWQLTTDARVSEGPLHVELRRVTTGAEIRGIEVRSLGEAVTAPQSTRY